MKLPDRVTLVEVGPRDGLQNEAAWVPTEWKIAFIDKLIDAGLRHIEATAFVHPSAVPQLADAEEVARRLPARPGVTYSALAPNEKGLERAIAAGIGRIAVFTAASQTFTLRNIRMSIEESLDVFKRLVPAALRRGLTVRGYISTCFVCPYEGEVPHEKVREVAGRLLDLGVDQVAISDTLGAASPRDVHDMVGFLLETIDAGRLALHFHDTYGTALANVAAGLELGVATFDASAGGLGGCPFAPGAAGNVATEDLAYLLERMGIVTGVSVEKVVDAAELMAGVLGRELPSRQWRRLRRGRPPVGETRKTHGENP